MDTELKRIIEMLHRQNDILGKARFAYLDKEATRRHFESTLIQATNGKSHAERTVGAQASDDWLEFHKKLARLESEFEFQKLKFAVIEREFLAVHLTLKLDATTLSKGG